MSVCLDPDRAVTGDVAVAVAAARAAGALVARHAGRVSHVATKSTALDLVTEIDVAAGVEAVGVIRDHLPDARFVVEEPEILQITEACSSDPQTGRVWVIDPIDGTTSFVHDYPCYSVSIGLLEDGVPRVGAVLNVATNEMHWASRGDGSFRDGQRLGVAGRTTLETAVLATGFPYDRARLLEPQLAVLGSFLRYPVQDVRRDGSAAVDCCHVAAGRCDGFWEFGLQLWDMAAGVLICSEAGARVTDIAGSDWSAVSDSICVANPALHDRMLEVIEGARGRTQ